MNQPPEEDKFDDFGRHELGLNQVKELIDEDDEEGTEIQQMGHNVDAMQYGPGQVATSNQLEVASMISGSNSVMNTSPIRSSRTRRNKNKIAS